MFETDHTVTEVVAEDALGGSSFLDSQHGRLLEAQSVELANELEVLVVLERLSGDFKPGLQSGLGLVDIVDEEHEAYVAGLEILLDLSTPGLVA